MSKSIVEVLENSIQTIQAQRSAHLVAIKEIDDLLAKYGIIPEVASQAALATKRRGRPSGKDSTESVKKPGKPGRPPKKAIPEICQGGGEEQGRESKARKPRRAASVSEKGTRHKEAIVNFLRSKGLSGANGKELSRELGIHPIAPYLANLLRARTINRVEDGQGARFVLA